MQKCERHTGTITVPLLLLLQEDVIFHPVVVASYHNAGVNRARQVADESVRLINERYIAQLSDYVLWGLHSGVAPRGRREVVARYGRKVCQFVLTCAEGLALQWVLESVFELIACAYACVWACEHMRGVGVPVHVCACARARVREFLKERRTQCGASVCTRYL